jgi:transformation/transcription domain-associated protein
VYVFTNTVFFIINFFFLLQNFVHPEVAEFIPLIMNTISLQPPQHLRQSPAFNKEVFVDFMGAQIKTLSFLAYIIRWVPVIQCSGSVNNSKF